MAAVQGGASVQPEAAVAAAQSWEEAALTALALAIVVAILALLVKRVALAAPGAGYEAGPSLM